MFGEASMGPRLGRVEYGISVFNPVFRIVASMGPRLGRVEYVCLPEFCQDICWLQWGHA